ncbi:hypothetical protein Tco_0290371 [Tanacetum coccineum]
MGPVSKGFWPFETTAFSDADHVGLPCYSEKHFGGITVSLVMSYNNLKIMASTTTNTVVLQTPVSHNNLMPTPYTFAASNSISVSFHTGTRVPNESIVVSGASSEGTSSKPGVPDGEKLILEWEADVDKAKEPNLQIFVDTLHITNVFRALTATADVPSSVTKITDTSSKLQPPPPPLQKPIFIEIFRRKLKIRISNGFISRRPKRY